MSETESKSSEILLFFHPNSQACIKLRDVVSKSKKNNDNIKYINISEIQTIPSNITSIPALIVNNNKVLQGKQVFDFFNKDDEEIEFFGFSSKLGGSTLASFYSSIEDDDENTIQNNKFSNLDSPNMNDGIPEYIDGDDKGIRMEDITARRANLDKELGLSEKPKTL